MKHRLNGWNPLLSKDQNLCADFPHRDFFNVGRSKTRYNNVMKILEKILAWIRKQYEICRLRLQIRSLRKQLEVIYRDLGKDYVDTHRNDPDDLNSEQIAEAVRLRKAIEDKESSIDEMRGIVRCAACGSRIPNGALFCPYCGMRQPDPEVKVVRYCPECGTKLEIDEIFCHHCGCRIPQDDAVTEEIVLHRPVNDEVHKPEAADQK